MKKRNHAILLYMTIEEFFTEYVKSNRLDNAQILIVSRDVVGDIKIKESYSKISYESRYDNITFVPSLIPSVASMEYVYGDDKSRFTEMYEGHLLGDDVFADILCIADMVVNDGIDVILLSSKGDFASTFPYILKDFVYKQLGINICLSEQLAEAESEEEYEQLLSLGDMDEIRTLLEFNKKELTEGRATADEFFNRFMEDAPMKYRKILMTKDKDYIIDLGKEKGIRMNRRKSKEELIDILVKEVFGDME